MEERTDTIPGYPLCILPKPTYLDLIDEDELWSKVNGLQIQRRCAENVDRNVLTPEIFGNNLAEMSVNLLGGEFLPEHVRFTPKKVCPLSVSLLFDPDGNYIYRADAQGVYLAIADIHDRTFPSARKFPNIQEYEKVKASIKDEDMVGAPVSKDSVMSAKERLVGAFRKTKGFSKDQDYNVEYRISVRHRPTNANYWHCQVEIDPAVKKDKAEWQKDALRALTNFLVGYASFEHKNPLPLIKKEWYIKETA